MDKFNKHDHRQIIVKKLVRLAKDISLKDVHEFDAVVCKALKIDQEENPPTFVEYPFQ